MLERDSGRFNHISSGMGIQGKPNQAAYTASKLGLEGFHDALTAELDGTGVDSVVLEPGGGVDTKGFSRYLSDAKREDRLDPEIVVSPALRLGAGAGKNGGRYITTRFLDEA